MRYRLPFLARIAFATVQATSAASWSSRGGPIGPATFS